MRRGFDDSDNKKESVDQKDIGYTPAHTKRCSICSSVTTYIEKTKWGPHPHWYGKSENPICKTCYLRLSWQKKYIPANAKCDICNSTETTNSRYGTPQWIKNSDREGGYLCRSCYTIKRNTGQVFSPERKNNLRIGIRRAVENGVVFGRKVRTINEAAFNAITEESAYWIGYLMADGNVYTGKTGNARIALTLAKEDYDHLVKFRKFMSSTYDILTKKVKLNDKNIVQYTLRFSSKIIASVLATYGVVPRKSLIAKVIGLENNRHFWRGVIDGDGWLGNRNVQDGDKITLTGSFDLLNQFKTFIETNISGSEATLKQDGKYYRLYIYSYTARAVAELLYSNCLIALHRKLTRAQKMLGYTEYNPNTLVAQQLNNPNPELSPKSG